MSDLKKYIESGVLEMYVLGLTDEKENFEIEQMRGNPEVELEIEIITHALRNYASSSEKEANPTIKYMVLAILDYHDRLARGERPLSPPELNAQSNTDDYRQWLERPDMVIPADFEMIHAKLIGLTEKVVTAIVWLQYGSPYEIHDHQYERFLIVEGTCDIIVGDKPYHMNPGDYMQIPLHSGHFVKVTSLVPCKVILQRVAA